MNKRMREILAEIEAKTAEAKSYMSGENKDVAKATAIMDEVDTLKGEYELEKRIFESDKSKGLEGASAHAGDGQTEKKEFSAEEIVAKEVRSIMTKRADKDLNESVEVDGGYTVPEDIVTKVNHYPEIVDSLLDEISVENVTTNKGARTYQTKAQTEAFIDLDENGAITKKIAAPQFERVTYNIVDRAGFMPVSNDLVNDSDANIMQIVYDWLGRANIATANQIILELIYGELDPENLPIFNGIADIKHAVNVTLGQAYKSGAKIITNDDGLNYLDTLVDLNGRPLLNPDPTDSAKLALRCGTVVVPVKVKSNKTLPSGEGFIPFIVGDLKAGIKKFNRQSMSLKASDTAVIGDFNAFAMNMTLIRAILRDDYKVVDPDAFVLGFIAPEMGE